MRVILRHRKTGKTHELIRLCSEAEKSGEVSYIVCSGREEANRIYQEAMTMNLPIGFPLTYEEFLYRQYAGKNIRNFFIDNADYLLERISSVPIRAVTMTKERKE